MGTRNNTRLQHGKVKDEVKDNVPSTLQGKLVLLPGKYRGDLLENDEER